MKLLFSLVRSNGSDIPFNGRYSLNSGNAKRINRNSRSVREEYEYPVSPPGEQTSAESDRNAGNASVNPQIEHKAESTFTHNNAKDSSLRSGHTGGKNRVCITAPILPKDPYEVNLDEIDLLEPYSSPSVETPANLETLFSETFALEFSANAVLVQISRAPLVIDFRVRPRRQTPLESYMELSVRDPKTREILARDGYGYKYSTDLEKTVVILEPGKYHITLYGKRVAVDLAIRTAPEDAAGIASTETGDQPEKTGAAARASRFTAFIDALERNGLDLLLGGPGPFTVFAPVDAAFEALVQEIPGISERLSHPDRDIRNILLHHIAAGEYSADHLVASGTIGTLQGSTLAVHKAGEHIAVNGATLSGTDILCSNGVIHVIDAVLLPPEADEQAVFTGDEPWITTQRDYAGPGPIPCPEGFVEIETYWIDPPYSSAHILKYRDSDLAYFLQEPVLPGRYHHLLSDIEDYLRTVLFLASQDATVTSIDPSLIKAIARRMDDSIPENEIGKIHYFLRGKFQGFGNVASLLHDENVDGICCRGPDTAVILTHRKYDDLLTNVFFSRSELDTFVLKLAQHAGKQFSRAPSEIFAELPNGMTMEIVRGNGSSSVSSSFRLSQKGTEGNT